MWRYVAPAFEQDYKVVLFDYVGSGKADITAYDKSRYASLDGYAQDVLDIIHALDLRDLIFVGHSVSSIVSILAANREPERFERLVLIGPSPRYINEDDPPYFGGFNRSDIDGLFELMDKNFIGWANFLAPAIMKNPDHPELGEELTQSFCSTDPIIARNFAHATFYSDNRRDVTAVKVPSLILQCTEDMVAPLEVGNYMHANMPNSTMRVMNATGHCPHMSHPDETIALIREYLETATVGT
jgi:sigma-B regulation protein RsbQ